MSPSLPTEVELTRAFLHAMAEPVKGMPSFETVVTELKCAQGRPDIVAVRARSGRTSDDRFLNSPTPLTFGKATVLTLLKPRALRTETYLQRITRLDSQALRRILRELEEAGLARRAGEQRWVAAKAVPKPELWAFELKVSDWRRALFQAQQYAAFADSVSVVMAADRVHRAKVAQGWFEKLGIGLLALDSATGKLQILTRARRRPPSSVVHRLVALSELHRRNGRDSVPAVADV